MLVFHLDPISKKVKHMVNITLITTHVEVSNLPLKYIPGFHFRLNNTLNTFCCMKKFNLRRNLKIYETLFLFAILN